MRERNWILGVPFSVVWKMKKTVRQFWWFGKELS